MSNTTRRAGAGRSRIAIISFIALLCAAAPSAALGSASVRGCVNTTGQSAISGATVSYSPVNGTPGGGASGQTDGTGCTQYMSVPAGQYDIEFYANHYDAQWYSNVAKQADATPVTVSDGQQYSYTAALNHKPQVTGKVIDANTGQPLANWLVQFYSPTLQSMGVSGVDTYTASDGTYSIDFENDPSTGYGPGDYTACVGDAVDSNTYVPDCYNGAATKDTGSPIHVSAETTTSGVDFSVIEAGRISGTTTPVNNDNMAVTAYDSAGRAVATGYGDGSGGWSVLVPAGTSYLRFHETPFADQYYGGKGGLSCANPLFVAFNGTTTAPSVVAMGYTAPTACPTTGGGGGTGGSGGTGGTGGGGSGGTGGSGGPGRGTPGAPAHQTVLLGSGGAGQVEISCSSTGPCSGSLQITVGALGGRAAAAGTHPTRVVIGSATFRNLAAGRTSSVAFRLNRAGARLLRSARRNLKATLALSFTSGGRTTTLRSAIVLRRH